MRRHRLVVGATLLAFVVLAVSLGVALQQRENARQAAREARAEAAVALTSGNTEKLPACAMFQACA